MKIVTGRTLLWIALGGLAAAMMLAGPHAARAQEAAKAAEASGSPEAKAPAEAELARLRPIRVAVFNIDVRKGVEEDPAALTDQLNAMLSRMPKVAVVNRDEIKKVAEEHKIALTGLVDNASAVRLGKFLSAQYVVLGGASKIGHTFFLVVKVIDVETTEQRTVSSRASVEQGLATALERLDDELVGAVRKIQLPPPAADEKADAWERLRKEAKFLAGKTVLVDAHESHINRPLKDPAVPMALAQRLRWLGATVIVPKDPIAGWKEALLQTGRYVEDKVDLLMEAEGTSAYAAEIHGLVSCRARVELRLIPVPGRNIQLAERGVAAKVDLVEALAAKAALEEAADQALAALVERHVKGTE